MRAAILSVGALALGVNGWKYPDCDPDNCYRQMTSDKNYEAAKAFCPGYLGGVGYPTIPKEYDNCGGDEKKVSSACSCITYTASTPVYPTTSKENPPVYPTTTPSYPTTKEPSSKHEYPTSKHEYPTSKPAPSYPMTTSTVYHTTVYTVTSCKPEVTNCPGKGHVTTEVTSYTTVCPVYPTKSMESSYKPVPPPPAPTYPPASPPPVGTGSYTPKPQPSSVVTAGAGKYAANIAVAAGAVAVALL